MSESSEPGSSLLRQNPLIWIVLVVIGLIVIVFVSVDRGDPMAGPDLDQNGETAESIERSLLVPPGMRARDTIEQLRDAGKPYPLVSVFEKAGQYLHEGSLADAHLLYFFAAREDHLPAIMKLGEMSDPTLFDAADSLLDDADVIQAYKWYQKAAAMGHPPATERVNDLQQWAIAEAQDGNPRAQQLLLNFE